jgi:hypothetical protein
MTLNVQYSGSLKMTTIFHRFTLVCVVLASIALGGCGTMKSVPDKVVYHINDTANATALMRNVGNHLDVDPTARIVVVSHAQGVDFLMTDAKDANGNPYNINVEKLVAHVYLLP